MFNAGVFCLNKTIYEKFKKYIDIELWKENFRKDPLWEDSKELNHIAQDADIKINWLEATWNFKNHPNAFFTHLWGEKKKINPNMPSIIKAREKVRHLKNT